jgi:hypothetical protein
MDPHGGRRLAGLVGPTLLVVSATEAWNLDLFSTASPALVSLNGTALFVAGLALIQARSRRQPGWPPALTLVGWSGLLGGLFRMTFPAFPGVSPGPGRVIVLGAVFVMGAVLCVQARRA